MRWTSISRALARERGGKLRVVGNLPYNISTPLLFHLLEHAQHIDDMHVMLQREVVDRIAAAPGNGTTAGSPSCWPRGCAWRSLFDVGPGAFQPPPTVWSSVARLTVRPRAGVRRRARISRPWSPPRSPTGARRCATHCATSSRSNRSWPAASTPERAPETLAPEAFNDLARSIDSR